MNHKNLKVQSSWTSKPLVSVVMACYNNEKHIENTLASLTNQCYPNIELIIIDDNSSDQTLFIIEGYLTSSSITSTIIKNKKNKGLTRSLIDGCQLAKGKYIARHDADDSSSSNRFSAQVEYLESNSDIDLVFTTLSLQDDVFNKTFTTTHSDSHNNEDCLNINDIENIECPSHHGSAMFASSLYHQSGGYRYQFYYSQDLDLWLRMRQHSNYAIINHATYTATFSTADISSYARKEQQLFKQLAIQSARNSADDSVVLNQAIKLHSFNSQYKKQTPERFFKVKTHYFIAACLLQKGHSKEARYYLLRTFPFLIIHPKYWLKLYQTFLK